ncbi:VOC family protein [Natronorarus salvus]|uniref:VOC family protein n=1 Tax=Natronorarus salvus TaxID=3117733 RepID=UPI002F269FC7
MTHAFSWVELPSVDFDRAIEFYSTVLDRGIDVHEPELDEANNGRAGMFHSREEADEMTVSGMIVETNEYTAESGATIAYTPSDDGVVVYLTVDGDLDDALSRVESTGGEVVLPKESIPDHGGHYAIIKDTEGNRVGLVSGG